MKQEKIKIIIDQVEIISNKETWNKILEEGCCGEEWEMDEDNYEIYPKIDDINCDLLKELDPEGKFITICKYYLNDMETNSDTVGYEVNFINCECPDKLKDYYKNDYLVIDLETKFTEHQFSGKFVKSSSEYFNRFVNENMWENCEISNSGVGCYRKSDFDIESYFEEELPPEIITDGEVKKIHNNGQISKKYNYKNGYKEGKYISYYQDGTKEYECNYKKGKLHGISSSWNDKGEITRESEYFNGNMDGFTKNYSDGKLTSMYESKNGKVVGTHKYFEKGKLYAEGNLNFNKKNGVWKIYYENEGYEEITYLNDVEHGKCINFYENGKLMSEGQFDKGKRTGKWKGYHENGNLRKLAVYKENIIISQKCWDKDGNKIECES